MGRIRDAITVQRLLDKFGDVTLSEVKHRLRNPTMGRKKTWDTHMLTEVFLCVEAIKAAGLRPTEAKKRCAKHLRLTEDQVEKRWREARTLIAPIFKDSEKEIMRLFIDDRPNLCALCKKISSSRSGSL